MRSRKPDQDWSAWSLLATADDTRYVHTNTKKPWAYCYRIRVPKGDWSERVCVERWEAPALE